MYLRSVASGHMYSSVDCNSPGTHLLPHTYMYGGDVGSGLQEKSNESLSTSRQKFHLSISGNTGTSSDMYLRSVAPDT